MGRRLVGGTDGLSGRERLAAYVGFAVRDEPGQGLVHGAEGTVARRVPQYLPGAGNAGGDAAERVLAGDFGVLGAGPPGELGPVDQVENRFTAEPRRDAGRQASQRHRLLGG